MRIVASLLITALAAVACDDAETKRKRLQAEQAAQSQAAGSAAGRAAEERLRATARNITPTAKLRGVVAHRQALGGYAVCGQVNLTGAAEDPYLPFVSVVSPDMGRIEQFVAFSSAEATRTYVETNTRCFDGGGPASARSVLPLPPVPDISSTVVGSSSPSAPGSTSGVRGWTGVVIRPPDAVRCERAGAGLGHDSLGPSGQSPEQPCRWLGGPARRAARNKAPGLRRGSRRLVPGRRCSAEQLDPWLNARALG